MKALKTLQDLDLRHRRKAYPNVPDHAIAKNPPPSDREAIVSKINKLFRVVPVDTFVAIKAGELWHNHMKNWKSIYKQKGQDGIRNRFKYDLLIAATAITRKADYLYTEDGPLTKLCEKYIEVGPLPTSGLGPQLTIPM